MQKYTKFKDIPEFTSSGNYRVNVGWNYIETWLSCHESLDLDPDFQRAHVWTEDKQIAYIEFGLRGGKSGRDIYFNQKGWMGKFEGPLVLVDGKQRLEAVRRFIHNEIPAFGTFFKDFEDKFPQMRFDFVFHVNDLKTRKEVLQWYIDLNSGGVVHTTEEIEKVKLLLKEEE